MVSQPGVAEFLAGARPQFETLVMFTTSLKSAFGALRNYWFASGALRSGRRYSLCPMVRKDQKLSFVSERIGDALLLDDYAPYVHLGQEHLWVEAPLFGSPCAMSDDGLSVASWRLLEGIKGFRAASRKMS